MIQASTANKTIVQKEQVAQQSVGNEAYSAGRLAKATFDYAVTLPGLLFIAPLFLILSLLVKLDSPGPIFYRRRVVGLNGRIFYAFKFRTMYINGDEILARHPKLRAELNKNYKLKCDPRVTRVGNFLRKFSLDELPQLFNVLMRDMSLIGPRMITPEEVSKYGEHGEKLLTVMPGLSGLWQVSGRSDVCYDERVELDMQYIDNWSVAEDFKILLKTPMVVLKGDGAY
ncbi:MAG: sugar transferase [Chloroflexota bacterium]